MILAQKEEIFALDKIFQTLTDDIEISFSKNEIRKSIFTEIIKKLEKIACKKEQKKT